ncbi:hypothetical protein TNIN_495451 [Trichonephila inaurata madagascariensis]|uniref:Uncharacterized protein n=1 Tax=Trichonephila inaurata madagascariensis TaxID=2747483 RepID=A0A8X7CB41_9ARAC|nr:hypothetical protein TNIN_495451 [Trichonephila inaurata madagascariensis]
MGIRVVLARINSEGEEHPVLNLNKNLKLKNDVEQKKRNAPCSQKATLLPRWKIIRRCITEKKWKRKKESTEIRNGRRNECRSRNLQDLRSSRNLHPRKERGNEIFIRK